MRFTDKGIQALKKRKARYEEVEDGGTGLAIRVSPKGIKTFSYLYRFGGKARRMTLGVYRGPSLDASAQTATHDVRGLPYVTLADARIKLAEAKKKRDGGIDPGFEAVKGHKTERKAQTVADLINAYVEKWAKLHKRPSSAAEDARALNKDVRPSWGERKASSITRADVIELLNGVVDRGSPIAANRLLAVVRKMFRWAVRQGIIAISPASEIDRPGGKELPRDRVLSPAEIAEVWHAAGALWAPYSQVLRLLLVTGQRRGEVAGMRRKEIDPDAKLWTIPRTRTKNGLDHEVPLSPLALEIVKSLPAKPDLDCVFVSSRRGDRPIRDFSGAKRRLDSLIVDARKEAAQRTGEDPAQVAPIPRWTLHDLRRTVRTGLSKLRLDPEISERVIGHLPAGVRRVYDVHQYRDEKREVLIAWAAHLKRIVNVKPAAAGGKIVRLRPAAQ